MEYILHIIDGTYQQWNFLVDVRPDLIGHSYTLKNVKAVLLDKAFCEMDFHYFRTPKPAIPKGTKVEILYYHFNFYGEYFRVLYNGKEYDIATKYIKLVRTEQQ